MNKISLSSHRGQNRRVILRFSEGFEGRGAEVV